MSYESHVDKLLSVVGKPEVGDFLHNPHRKYLAGVAIECIGNAGKADVIGWVVDDGHQEFHLYDPDVWYKNATWTRDVQETILEMRRQDDDSLIPLIDTLMTVYSQWGNPDEMR